MTYTSSQGVKKHNLNRFQVEVQRKAPPYCTCHFYK